MKFFIEQHNASPWEICSHARELYTSIYFVNLNKMLLEWGWGGGWGELEIHCRCFINHNEGFHNTDFLFAVCFCISIEVPFRLL